MKNITNNTKSIMPTTKPKPLPMPLNILEKFLENYSPPTDNFDPAGDYSSSYKMLSMAGGGIGSHAGDLSLHKKTISENEAVIEFDFTKFGLECRQTAKAKIRFKTNELDSPVNWKYESKMVDMQDITFKNSEVKKSGSLKNNSGEFVCKNKIRKIKSKKPFALSWLLFDAVQNLPRKKNDPIEFTLIDHFDQIKPDNQISFHGSISINIPKKENLKLHVYDQLGDGIVPIVYYVDDSGRLLFVVSGIEAYTLNS